VLIFSQVFSMLLSYEWVFLGKPQEAINLFWLQVPSNAQTIPCFFNSFREVHFLSGRLQVKRYKINFRRLFSFWFFSVDSWKTKLTIFQSRIKTIFGWCMLSPIKPPCFTVRAPIFCRYFRLSWNSLVSARLYPIFLANRVRVIRFSVSMYLLRQLVLSTDFKLLLKSSNSIFYTQIMQNCLKCYGLFVFFIRDIKTHISLWRYF